MFKNLYGIFLGILPVFFVTQGIGQTDSCSCIENYQQLVQKIEENYIAYHLTIKNDQKELNTYNTFKKKLEAEAATKTDQDCIGLLKQFTKYFKDGHLAVLEQRTYTENELAQFREAVKKIPFTETAAKNYFSNSSAELDAIEGIWYTSANTYKLAVVKADDQKNRFYAIVLESKNSNWQPGFVKAVIEKNSEGYNAVYYNNNFSPVQNNVQLSKQVLLKIGNNYWGRLYPVKYVEQSLLHPDDAALPTFKKTDDTSAVLSIPSFLIEYKDLDSLLRINDAAIRQTRNLLIDIRGNSGGNAIYFQLINYYYNRPAGDAAGLAIASPDQIAYFKRLSSFQRRNTNDTTLNLYERVVRDMQLHPGEIVKGPVYPVRTLESPGNSRMHVGILTDRACASAAESFILHSKAHNEQLTVFGQPTYGMIDYTSTNTILLLCRNPKYFLIYPTSTLHAQIPEKGYNKTGIVPDVKIDAKTENQIQVALDWLRGQK